MDRIQTKVIVQDLQKKMVFLVGPRQVGKTYVAKQITQQYASAIYLNYDNLEDKKIIESKSWLSETQLVVLDELHKMPNWKNYLKGLYDTKPQHLHILVTGSARLDIFDKLGDSLAGRYFLHRLLPLSPAELAQLKKPASLDQLLEQGGFPEPFLAENKIDAERWRLQYVNSMLATDVFEFDQIQNIKALRLIFELLRSKVGSPISYQSIAEDVSVSPVTVKKYIEILEALFIIFRITPFSKNIARSLLKEPKIYFFDNGLVKGDEGAKLENLVAVSLLKYVYEQVDYQAKPYALHFLRNKEGQEIDFALVCDDQIEQMIEVKNKDTDISKSLYAFNKKYHHSAVQIVKQLTRERLSEGISIVRVDNFLSKLKIF